MKSAQASQAKQENDTIKRSALVPEDCGGLREGRKDRQQSIVKQKRLSSICDDDIVTIQKLILRAADDARRDARYAREATTRSADVFDHFERTSHPSCRRQASASVTVLYALPWAEAVQNSTCSHATVLAQPHETKQD